MMVSPDDPTSMHGLILQLLFGPIPTHETACAAALDLLGVTDPADRQRVALFLATYAIQYQHLDLAEVSRPTAREIGAALNDVVSGAQKIDAALTVLRRARQTTRDEESAGEEQRSALFPLVVAAIREPLHLPEHKWRGGYEDPFAGAFAGMADKVRRISEWYAEDRVADPPRSQHPALTKLICHLAAMFEEWTGKRAGAAYTGDRPGYETQFVQFVHAFAPMAGISPILPAKTIAKALRLYSRLRQKKPVIGGTDSEQNPCHFSMHQHETARDDDHEA